MAIKHSIGTIWSAYNLIVRHEQASTQGLFQQTRDLPTVMAVGHRFASIATVNLHLSHRALSTHVHREEQKPPNLSTSRRHSASDPN